MEAGCRQRARYLVAERADAEVQIARHRRVDAPLPDDPHVVRASRRRERDEQYRAELDDDA